ncbi:MAG: PQQ-binding-like beta-propeller repeat protein [Planctomycetaceae bacterium]
MGITTSGAVGRYEFTSEGSSYFREITPYDLRVPVDVKPVVAGDKLYVATSDGKLQVIDSNSLTVTSTVNLPAPATEALWVTRDTLLVQADNKLFGFSMGEELTEKWSVSLTGGPIVVKPTVKGDSIFTSDLSGRILSIELENGNLTEMARLDVPLVLPLFTFGNEVLAATVDGSLYRLTNLFSP